MSAGLLSSYDISCQTFTLYLPCKRHAEEATCIKLEKGCTALFWFGRLVHACQSIKGKTVNLAVTNHGVS